jgi:hypothetical protein
LCCQAFRLPGIIESVLRLRRWWSFCDEGVLPVVGCSCCSPAEANGLLGRKRMRRFSSLWEGRWVLVGLVWLVAEGEIVRNGLAGFFLLACLLACWRVNHWAKGGFVSGMMVQAAILLIYV